MSQLQRSTTALSGTLAAGASASAVGSVSTINSAYNSGGGFAAYTRVSTATITNSAPWPNMPDIEGISTASIRGQANSSLRLAQVGSRSFLQLPWGAFGLSQTSGFGTVNAGNSGGSPVTFNITGETYDVWVQTGTFMQAGM